MGTPAAISVEHLVKRYKGAERNAVDDISFKVAQGSLFALLGPNGAGKTTTDRKSTRLNSSHIPLSRMPSSA